jgi:deoxyribodipyrimidine photo-lyase
MLFIFRRDLRTADNHGLRACFEASVRASCRVVPIFIFTPSQADASKNPYYSEKSFTFMLQSLADLEASVPELRLYDAKGNADGGDTDVLDAIARSTPELRAVYFNADTTPFALRRDAAIADWCRKKGLACVQCTTDYCLVDPMAMEKPYQRFTPFYNKYIDDVDLRVVRAPPPRSAYLACTLKAPSIVAAAARSSQDDALMGMFQGGRGPATAILRRISGGAFERYASTRDEVPNDAGTTRLSPYLKFGCVSVREAFAAVQGRHGRSHGLIRELMWRAFYDQVAYHFPNVLRGQVSSSGRRQRNNASLSEKYDRILWEDNEEKFDAWCVGKTGVPLVDAGMRQLAEVGYMHNRLRMITASFLIKSLHVDWRLGERFFAQHLVDYHPSANSGGWQWASGGGADSQQFNRTFSPWVQAVKHDPQCVYIRRYVPELSEVPIKDILSWETSHARYKHRVAYPEPIVNHREEVKAAVAAYKRAMYNA